MYLTGSINVKKVPESVLEKRKGGLFMDFTMTEAQKRHGVLTIHLAQTREDELSGKAPVRIGSCAVVESEASGAPAKVGLGLEFK